MLSKSGFTTIGTSYDGHKTWRWTQIGTYCKMPPLYIKPILQFKYIGEESTKKLRFTFKIRINNKILLRWAWNLILDIRIVRCLHCMSHQFCNLNISGKHLQNYKKNCIMRFAFKIRIIYNNRDLLQWAWNLALKTNIILIVRRFHCMSSLLSILNILEKHQQNLHKMHNKICFQIHILQFKYVAKASTKTTKKLCNKICFKTQDIQQ